VIASRVDGRLAGAAVLVAADIQRALHGLEGTMAQGTVYLGTGSADLIRGGDVHPHVVVPLITSPLVDAVSRAQIASADVLVAMDRSEASRLMLIAPGRPIVCIAEGVPAGRGVIHTGNPFDAVEVQEFLALSPHLAEYLPALGLDLRPFDTAPVTNAIAEAIVLASLASSGSRCSDSPPLGPSTATS
jgi:hypothetical protein